MPTWPGHQRISPVRTSERGTSDSEEAIRSAVRGTGTPAERQARWTSPEQSKHVGPTPPQQYRLPTCAAANRATAAPRPVVGGSRPAHARSMSDDGDPCRGIAAEDPKSPKRGAAK